MWHKIKGAKEDKAKLVTEMQGLIKRGEDERRDLNSDESARFDELRSQADKLTTDIERMEAVYRNGGVAGPPQPGRDEIRGELPADATEVRALKPDEKAIDYLRSRNPNFGRNAALMSVPRIMRAMACGPRNAEERTILAESSDSTGGVFVNPTLAANYIDVLRKKAVSYKAGAQSVVLESNNHSFARITADPTPAWRAENAAVSESEPTFDRVQFLPKSLAVLVKSSRELLQDAVNMETAIEHSLTAALAVALDGAALLGTGSSSQPLGLSGISGIPVVDLGTNGAQLTSYDPLLDAVYQQRLGNANDPTAFIMAPRTLNTIDKFKDSQNRPLARPVAIANTPFYNTTAMPINETHGTAVNASRIIAGDFSQLWIGIRSELRIEVLRERFADNLQYAFIAWLRADVQVQHAASFCQITGIIP